MFDCRFSRADLVRADYAEVVEGGTIMTAAESEVKSQVEVSVDDFAGLVAYMSRLLAGLVKVKPLEDANLSLAEWVALSMLAQKDGVNNKQLARNLGVSGQRVNQICAALRKTELISVEQSGSDSRASVIKITDSGRAQIATVNMQLKSLLSEVLKGRGRTLVSITKLMRQLMRLLDVGSADVGDARKKRRSRKAAKAKADN